MSGSRNSPQEPAVLDSLRAKALALEREAYHLRQENKIDQAFEAYDRAASLYRDAGEDFKAALCYASAATCWNIHTGWRPLNQAATRSHYGAEAAMRAGHYDYARTLFHEAAMLYEKEGDAEQYSECFMATHRARRKAAWENFWKGKSTDIAGLEHKACGSERTKSFFLWLLSLLNGAIWGHGERPLRTLGTAWTVMLGSAVIYRFSGLIESVSHPQHVMSFLDSLYFSIVTFSTVGYGDYVPVGWVRGVAVLEGLFGITLLPLFVISLTRRYLRLSR